MDCLQCEFRRKVSIYRAGFKKRFGHPIERFCSVEGFDLFRFMFEIGHNLTSEEMKKAQWILDRLRMTPVLLRYRKPKRSLQMEDPKLS